MIMLRASQPAGEAPLSVRTADPGIVLSARPWHYPGCRQTMRRSPAVHLGGAIHTFEGTGTIQNLIVGRDITGVSAFTAGA